MLWAENLDNNTVEQQEIRTRMVMAKFILREELNLVGIEIASGQPVIWCGFHDIDWKARQCDTGFWVRKSTQGRGFATEATNALLRYAFGALGLRRVGITHSGGNEASRRVADKHCYARLDLVGLPSLEVQWGVP
jgi:RimJ/RimL family protein N-acetyltransferase